MTPSPTPSLDELADSAVELAALRRSADDILERMWSAAAYLKLLDGEEPAYDSALWNTVVDLGWPDVLVGQGRGGGGGGLGALCVLAEAAGAATAPIPLAISAAAAWCEDRCVDGVPIVMPGPAAQRSGGVSATWPVVRFGAAATRLLVLATDAAESTTLGIVNPDGPGVRRVPLIPLDRNPAAEISLEQAPLEIIARGEDAARRHAEALLRARLAAVAELVGIAVAAHVAAVDYAKVRFAFERPIGSFQAIKHRLVDERAAIEVARALVIRAADAGDRHHPDFPALVSLAAFWGLVRLRGVPEAATQVFGGIAYTWEHEAHAHLRRAASSAAALGRRADHRAVVAQWLAQRHRR